MSNESFVETGLSIEEILAAREQLRTETDSSLLRVAEIVGSLASNFAYVGMSANTMVTGGKDSRILQMTYDTPRIVLPAQEVYLRKASPKEGNPPKRRVAVNLSLYYDYPTSEDMKEKAQFPKEGEVPVPDQAYISSPNAIALSSEANRDPKFKYDYQDNVTVSWRKLDMYPYCVDGWTLGLPDRFRSQRDELCNFDTFCSYPPEGLEGREDIVDYHSSRIQRFNGMLDVVCTALENPDLNPRKG